MKSSNTSASTSSSGASSSNLAPAGHGLRSQLGHLIPKHALFRVHLVIDQVSNVPLIKGEFAVRWKFKGAHSPSILGKVAAGSRSWSGQAKGKGKGREAGFGSGAVVTRDSDLYDDEEGSLQDSTLDTTEDDSYADSADSPKSIHSQYHLDSLQVPDGSVPHGHSVPSRPAEQQGSIPMARLSSASAQSEARGITSWEQLQGYNVKWNHSVHVVVQMDVHRETNDLLHNELKLVVMQRVVHGDPDSPQHPRLGVVYLNLAEYADAGKVTRRYLLRQSKTNATLKLSIELEHIGGEKHYKAPPLRKGEILASVSGILSNNGLFNTRFARELDLYVGADITEDDSSMPYVDKGGHVHEGQLATSYGLRTTEYLIEALFNPVPSDSTDQTPFTYYVPPMSTQHQRTDSPTPLAKDAAIELSNGDGRRSVDSSVGSGSFVGSTSEHSSFDPGMAADAATMASNRHWWQKMRRPTTPAASKTAFRPNTPALPSVPVRGG